MAAIEATVVPAQVPLSVAWLRLLPAGLGACFWRRGDGADPCGWPRQDRLWAASPLPLMTASLFQGLLTRGLATPALGWRALQF